MRRPIFEPQDALASANEAVALYVEGLREEGESLDMRIVRGSQVRLNKFGRRMALVVPAQGTS